ncbi:hypothetical protein A0H81_13176 [Grifola frondosa]|uniref:Uncharacterized protein n=1 Tax=Grifola frondosa TaxID=5627 RepID=A0A1C7LPK8_GRIFR|nr:hypothetical protein A0H81_13176 [Grifola frondosa]
MGLPLSSLPASNSHTFPRSQMANVSSGRGPANRQALVRVFCLVINEHYSHTFPNRNSATTHAASSLPSL